ncbi:hypothetical protein ABZ645_15510 [Nocardiopsis alba]|uniref:hypothetical protein n=1 Tax=Nocardiopsis alba TaxID=53437 RepID=UPI0033E71C4E
MQTISALATDVSGSVFEITLSLFLFFGFFVSSVVACTSSSRDDGRGHRGGIPGVGGDGGGGGC